MRMQDIQGIATKLGMTVEQYIAKRENNLKWCGQCKEWFEEVDFCKDASTTDGLTSICRMCGKKKDAKYGRSLQGKFTCYKKEARRRHMEFSLSFEEFKMFWNKSCSYCGQSIQTVGIDRINSEQRYCLDNCVSCCYTCNEMKSVHTKDFWLAHMKKILEHQGII